MCIKFHILPIKIGNLLFLHQILRKSSTYELPHKYFAIKPNSNLGFFLFENDKEIIQKHCKISILNETSDRAINLDKNIWAITTLKTYETIYYLSHISDPQILKYSFDIVHLSTMKQALVFFFLLSNDNLTSEVDSRNISINFLNFER